MGYSTLKAALDAVVKTNGRQQITGANLNGVMTTLLKGVDVMDRSNPADTSGMNKVVLDKTKTLAEQLAGANTIYEVRDNFSLSADLSIPSGCLLQFNGGSINPNGHSISGTIANEFIMPEWFGAKGDGVTDDSAAFIAVAALVNNGSTGKIRLSQKSYYLTEQVNIRRDIDFDGGNARLICRGNSPHYGLCFSKETRYSEVNVVSVSGTKGDNYIVVGNAAGLSVGDYIVLQNTNDYSWCLERAYYRQGDYFKITDIDGTKVYLSESLTDNYTSDIKVYKCNTIHVILRNLTIDGYCVDGTTSYTIVPVGAFFVVDGVFSNIVMFGSNSTHLQLHFCRDTFVNGIFVDYNSANVSLNYGISVECCKNLLVEGCNLKTHRHGLTIGGAGTDLAIPNRYVVVDGSSIAGYSTDNGALDSHANAQYVSFINNTIDGGIDMQASDFVVRGNQIRADKNRGHLIYIVSTRYHRGIIQDNELRWDKVNIKDSAIFIYTSVDDDNDSKIVIQGNLFVRESTTEITNFGCHIRIENGQKVIGKVIVKDNVFLGNDANSFNKDMLISSASLGELIVSGNEMSQVQIEKTALISSTYFKGNKFVVSGVSNLIFNGANYCLLEGNTFENDTYPITANATTENESAVFVVTKNIFHIESGANGRGACYIGKASVFIFVDNFIYTLTSTHWNSDGYMGTITKVIMYKNKYACTQPMRPSSSANVTTYFRDYGPTAERPTAYLVEGGFQYYDTDLKKTIMSNSSTWVNVDGSALS